MDLLPFAFASLVVALGAFVQGSVGFGYALVAAPLLALLSEELVPGPVMLASLGLSIAAALREQASIDRRGVVLALAGRLPGAMLGGYVLASLPRATVGAVFGGLVLLAVAISVSGLRLPLGTRSLVGTGFVSGVMGTMTSIGGPPMALLYQHESGPSLRATLNAYFALGSLMSLPVLWWAGYFGSSHVISGFLLVPGTALGFLLSGKSRAFLDRGRTRAAVLAVAGVSALAVVVKVLV